MSVTLLKDSKETEDDLSFKAYTSSYRILFKTRLLSSIITYEKYPCILTLLKFLLGFIFIGLPSCSIFFLVYIITPVYTKYIIFPYILSISIFLALAILILIIRLKEDCQMAVIFTSWERIGFKRLFSSIVFFSFLLYALMKFEQFFLIFPILQGNISQMQKKESFTREINQGSFINRLLFISFFWDAKQEKLGYFDLTVDFQKEFRSRLQYFVTPILVIAFYYCFKMLLFKTKNTVVHLFICLIVIYEGFYFSFYPIGDKVEIPKNFFYNNSKIFELIPLIFLVLGLAWRIIQNHIIALLKNKLYSYRERKSDLFTFTIVIMSFIIIIAGLSGVLYTLLALIIAFDIEPSLEFKVFSEIGFVFAIGLLCSIIGNSFFFGHYAFALVYKPIAYESCNHAKKNNHYIKCAHNMRNLNIKRKKRRKIKTHLMD